MTRVGITPPKVTITADDKRLKAGKPAPDPFVLAASECCESGSAGRQLGSVKAREVLYEIAQGFE